MSTPQGCGDCLHPSGSQLPGILAGLLGQYEGSSINEADRIDRQKLQRPVRLPGQKVMV